MRRPVADLFDVIADVSGIEHATSSHRIRADCSVTIPSCLSVRKAVFPAAGLGTRFLPATKAQPKEMLPLVDKPIIQYGVEEAVASGIDNIILVTGRGKNAIEDHFDVSVELETFLEARGKREQLEEVRKISNMINFAYVRQGEPLGLGHAVLVTRELVGDEPFAVILGDDVIDADPPAIKQLIDVFERLDGPVLAVERVPREDISSYGVIAIEPNARSRRRASIRCAISWRSRRREEAPSDLAIIGRYVLTPDIFPALAATKSDRTGEIQLTNGLRELLKTRPIYACEVKGVRHDTGNKLGFLKAVVYFALRRPDLAEQVLGLPRRRSTCRRRRQALGLSTLGVLDVFGVDVLGVGRRRRRRRRRRRSSLDDDVSLFADASLFSRLRRCRRRTSPACRPSSALSDLPPSAFARRALVLLRVVGDVEAAALELDRRRRHQLVHVAAALRARVIERIRELLNLLEAVTAGVTFVFVQRHLPLSYSSRSPLSSPSIS